MTDDHIRGLVLNIIAAGVYDIDSSITWLSVWHDWAWVKVCSNFIAQRSPLPGCLRDNEDNMVIHHILIYVCRCHYQQTLRFNGLQYRYIHSLVVTVGVIFYCWHDVVTETNFALNILCQFHGRYAEEMTDLFLGDVIMRTMTFSRTLFHFWCFWVFILKESGKKTRLGLLGLCSFSFKNKVCLTRSFGHFQQSARPHKHWKRCSSTSPTTQK